jgi:hypothetical protein
MKVAMQPSSLEYSFTLAWSIHGGIVLPEGVNRLDLLNSQQRQIYLCTEIPDDLQKAISQQALGNAVLNKRIGAYNSSLSDAHKRQVDQLVKEVEDKAKGRVILCCCYSGTFSGEIVSDRCFWVDDSACLHYDAFDDSTLTKQAQDDVCMVKLALSQEFRGDLEYQHILDHFGYRDSHRRPYFRFRLTFCGGKAYGGKRIVNTLARSITGFLENDRESCAVVGSPMALFSILTRVDADPLLAFTSGWAALDTLTKNAYEIISPRDKKQKRRWESEICDLIKQSQCEDDDKAINSRFLMRFAALTRYLFGDENAEDVMLAIKECWDEYKKRNMLYHDGGELTLSPSINFLSRNLTKYLYAFIDCNQMRQHK